MKLNNKGFAISSIMYIILIMAVILISVTLAILSSRKLILDKVKKETADNIYGISYNSVINTLKQEAISYASSNNIEQENIKIGDFETSVSQELLEHHELLDKYLTVYKNNYGYDVYLGQTKKVTDISKSIDNMIGIVDYKIYGNSYQETRSGKNLFKINNLESTSFVGLNYEVTDGTVKISGTQTGNFELEIPCNLTLKANTKYSISGNFVGTIINAFPVFYFSKDEIPNGSEDIYISYKAPDKIDFLVFEDTEINYFIIQSSVKNSVWENVELKIQVEEGSSVTAYEPYGVSPSPEFPSEIKSVGDYNSDIEKYEIPIKVTGKNLFNLSQTDFENGSNYGEGKKVEILLKPNTTYTLSSNVEKNILPDGYDTNIWFNGENSELNGVWSGQSRSLTTDSSGKLFIAIRSTKLEEIFNGTYWIQLEEGDTATAYEPYVEPVTTNIYLDEPLRKIVDSSDKIDSEQGIVYRNIKKIILDGSYKPYLGNWRNVEGYFAVGYAQSIIPDSYKTNKIGKILCEQLPNKTYENLYSINKPIEGISTNTTSSYSIFVRLKTNTITTVDEYKEYLNSNPLTINYVSTSSDSQPTNLPNIQTIVGSSMIEVDTSIPPSSVEFTIIENIRKL